MSIMVGTGRGAHAGVLVKNAEALQAFEKVDILVIDKTGTLTEGRPRLIGVGRYGTKPNCWRSRQRSRRDPNIRLPAPSSREPKSAASRCHRPIISPR
jgi:magnesium-transporting ATPase (P-type)